MMEAMILTFGKEILLIEAFAAAVLVAAAIAGLANRRTGVVVWTSEEHLCDGR